MRKIISVLLSSHNEIYIKVLLVIFNTNAQERQALAFERASILPWD